MPAVDGNVENEARFSEVYLINDMSAVLADRKNSSSRSRDEAFDDWFLEPDPKRVKLISQRTVEEKCGISIADNNEAKDDAQNVGNENGEPNETSDGKKDCASHGKNAEKITHEAYEENAKCKKNLSDAEDATDNEEMVKMECMGNGKCRDNDGDNTGSEAMDCEDDAARAPGAEQAGPAPQSSWSGILVSTQAGAITAHRAAAVPVTLEATTDCEETRLYNFPLHVYTHAVDTRLCSLIMGRKLTPFEKQFVQLNTMRSSELKEKFVLPLRDYLGNPQRRKRRNSNVCITSGEILSQPVDICTATVNRFFELAKHFHEVLSLTGESEIPMVLPTPEKVSLISDLNKETESKIVENLELPDVSDRKLPEKESALFNENEHVQLREDCKAEFVQENTVERIEKSDLISTKDTDPDLSAHLNLDPIMLEPEKHGNRNAEIRGKELAFFKESQLMLNMTESSIVKDFASETKEVRESDGSILNKNGISKLKREVSESDVSSLGSKTKKIKTAHLSQVPVMINIDQAMMSTDELTPSNGTPNASSEQTDLEYTLHDIANSSSFKTSLVKPERWQSAENLALSYPPNLRPHLQHLKICSVIDTLIYINDLKQPCADADFIKSIVSILLKTSVEEILSKRVILSPEQFMELEMVFDILFAKKFLCVHPNAVLSGKYYRNDLFKGKAEAALCNEGLQMHENEKICSESEIVSLEKDNRKIEYKYAVLNNQRHQYIPNDEFSKEIGNVLSIEHFERTAYGYDFLSSVLDAWPPRSFERYRSKLEFRASIMPPFIFRFKRTKLVLEKTISVGRSTSEKNSHLFTEYAKKAFPYTFKVNITPKTQMRKIESSQQIRTRKKMNGSATDVWQDSPISVSAKTEKLASHGQQCDRKSSCFPASSSMSPKFERGSQQDLNDGLSTSSPPHIELPSIIDESLELLYELLDEEPKSLTKIYDECRTDIFPSEVDAAIAGPSRQSDVGARTTSGDTRPTQRTTCSDRFESILAYLHRIVSRVTGIESHFEANESGIYGEHRSLYKRPANDAARCYVSKGQRRVDVRTVDRTLKLSDSAVDGLLYNSDKDNIQDYGRLVYRHLILFSGTPTAANARIKTQLFLLREKFFESYVENIYAMTITATDLGTPSPAEALFPQKPASNQTAHRTRVDVPQPLDLSTPSGKLVPNKPEAEPHPSGPNHTTAEPHPSGPNHTTAEPVLKSKTNETISTVGKFQENMLNENGCFNPDKLVILSENSGKKYFLSPSKSLSHFITISSPQTTALKTCPPQVVFSTDFLTTTVTDTSVTASTATSVTTSTATSVTTSTATSVTTLTGISPTTTTFSSAIAATTASFIDSTANLASSSSVTSAAPMDTPRSSSSLHPSQRWFSSSSPEGTLTFHLSIVEGLHALSRKGKQREHTKPLPAIISGGVEGDLLGYEIFLLQKPLAFAEFLQSHLTDVIQRLTPIVLATARDQDGRSTIIYGRLDSRTFVEVDSSKPLAPRHAMLLSEYLGYYHGVMTVHQMRVGLPSSEFTAELEDPDFIINALIKLSKACLARMEDHLLAEGGEHAKVRKYIYERYYQQSRARFEELLEGFSLHCLDFVTLVNGCVAPSNITIFASKEQVTDIKLMRWHFGHENYCVYDLLCLIVLGTDACGNQPYLSALVLTYIRAFENIHAAAGTGLKFSESSFKLMMEYSCRRLVVQMLAQPGTFFPGPDWLRPVLAAVEKTMHILGDYLLPSQSRPNASLFLGND